MKRLLLSFAAAALVASAASADEMTVTWADQGYTNNQAVTSYASGAVTVAFSSTKYNTNSQCLQVGSNSTVTISAKRGYDIDNITIKGDPEWYWTADMTFSNGTVSGLVDQSVLDAMTDDEYDAWADEWLANGPQIINYTADNDVNTMTIKASSFSPARFMGMTVTYHKRADAKEDAILSFPEQMYLTKLNASFAAPELTTNSDAAVAYSSSNEAVATVDAATGAVTLVGKGVTVITANSPETANYYDAAASYTLVVQNAYNGSTVDINWDDCNFVNGQEVTSYSESPVSILFEKGRNGSLPRYYTSTKLQIQALNDVTISVDEGYVLEGITFVASAASANLRNDCTVDTGTLSDFSTTEVKWVPADSKTTSVKLSMGMYNARLTGMVVKYKKLGGSTTGIATVEAEEADTAVYYNLQGVRVANPERGGVYVRVAGGKATKVVM